MIFVLGLNGAESSATFYPIAKLLCVAQRNCGGFLTNLPCLPSRHAQNIVFRSPRRSVLPALDLQDGLIVLMWKYTKFFMAVKMLNYRFALIAATALTVLWLLAYQHNHQSSFKGHLPNFPSLTNPLELDRNDSDASGGSCNDFAEQSSVVVTVKTGATEAYSRVFTLMSTIYQCYASNTYIFSDIEQTIGPYRIHNALAAYPDDFKRSNTDFELYFEQQRLKELGVITTSLHDMKNSRQSGDLASWILDKYKNTHIWEMIYSQRPQADWYLHVDADTYVVWSSLEAWLPHLDPSEELFMGSTAYLSNIGFLHGGSGILASRATMENYAVTHQGIASRWNDKIHNECCGDYVLARALDECGIQITNAWPSINGESPSTIPFNDKHWCQPVVTLHHMSSEEVQTFYQFEARRKNPKVYS